MTAALGPLPPVGIPDLLEQLGMSSSSWQYTTSEALAARWFPHTDAAIPLVIDGVRPDQWQPVVAALARAYPVGHGVWTMSHDASGNACQPARYSLEEVGETMCVGGPHTLLVPPLAEECSLTQLPNILARLRAPDGCPWDREQTLESLRFQVVSEVHEVIEAIDLQDDENLAEELGDLLLDTFFLINIGYEEDRFHMADVLAEISRKMIRRHPHVFGDSQAEDSDSVLKEWDQIKQAEYRAKGKERGPLDGIAKGLPALEGARLMQSRSRPCLQRQRKRRCGSRTGTGPPALAPGGRRHGRRDQSGGCPAPVQLTVPAVRTRFQTDRRVPYRRSTKARAQGSVMPQRLPEALLQSR